MKNKKNIATAVVSLSLGLVFGWAADSGLKTEVPIISVMTDGPWRVFTKGPNSEVRVEKPKHSFNPGVNVYADGRVIITKLDGAEHKAIISQKAMESLRRAFHEPDFLSITPEVLKKRMATVDAATHTAFGIEDGGFWTLSVDQGSSNHTVRVYAPFACARHYTNVQELRILTNLITLPYSSAGMKVFE